MSMSIEEPTSQKDFVPKDFAPRNFAPRNFAPMAMVLFFVCFILAAIVSQVYSGISPTLDYSPYDYFTGGALWMASSVCLMLAMSYSKIPLKMLFWLAGCGVLAVLAIDEFMGVHEATEGLVGDDDHIKLLLWAGAPVGLYFVWRLENASRVIALLFALGFVLQTSYLTVDVGDGDYFTLPVALTTLQWIEDTCELLFVSSYLAGFMLLLIKRTEAPT